MPRGQPIPPQAPTGAEIDTQGHTHVHVCVRDDIYHMPRGHPTPLKHPVRARAADARREVLLHVQAHQQLQRRPMPCSQLSPWRSPSSASFSEHCDTHQHIQVSVQNIVHLSELHMCARVRLRVFWGVLMRVRACFSLALSCLRVLCIRVCACLESGKKLQTERESQWTRVTPTHASIDAVTKSARE
jgi:hypothetical protein